MGKSIARGKKRKKKGKILEFLLHNETFDTDIWITIGRGYEEAQVWWQKKCKTTWEIEKDSPETDRIWAAVLRHPHAACCCIWFRWPKPPARHIAHEAMHATFSILGAHYLKLSADTEEVYARFMEWLVGGISRRAWK